MAVTQIADVIVPAVFQNYITENSLVSTALFQSGVAVQNGEMSAQLSAGAQSFTVPCWNDLIDTRGNNTVEVPGQGRHLTGSIRGLQGP